MLDLLPVIKEERCESETGRENSKKSVWRGVEESGAKCRAADSRRLNVCVCVSVCVFGFTSLRGQQRAGS